MLIALLLVAAQPGPASPQDQALEASPTFRAYREWRICLDNHLGRSPRPQAGRAELEAAYSACRPKEEALGSMAKAEWGPVAGPPMFEGFSKDIRAEYGIDAGPH
jgi:hypothetical protein